MRDPIPPADPYATLGLDRGAPMADVKRAYRRLAKAYHPDSAGEAALPRFLAIHEAYEAIRTGRPMSAARRATTGTPGGGRRGGPTAEPWRADPERARAARERARRGSQARAERPSSGTSAGTDGSGGTSPGTGTGGAAGAGSGTGAGRSRGRRATRKATLGSTSYDEARDPNDATWSGASWYGPSTGEYWIINPREYADPRKHGPEYQSRARRMAAEARAASGAIGEADAGTEGTAGPSAEPGPDTGFRTAGEAHWTVDLDASFEDGPASRAEPRASASSARAAEPAAPPGSSRRRQWTGSAERPDAQHDRPAPADGRTLRRSGGMPCGSTPREWLGGPADDPVRRFGIALVAWPPVGLAAAALIGDATGCSVYSAGCSGAEPLLPWLAQAGILGLLLLLPPAARILAGGTVGVLFALVPVTAFLVAVGGSGAPQAGFALTFLLVLAWAAGLAWAAVSQLRGARAGAPGRAR